LRVAFIVYQGAMFSGGQGVFVHYLSRELTRLGHEVHVIAGRPFPLVDEDVRFHPLKTYRMWDFMDDIDEYRYRTNPPLYFHTFNFYELVATRMSLGSLLFTFSMRAYLKLHQLHQQTPFDLVHDNQTLSYGILLMKRKGLPVVASVHHPLTIDRRNRLAQVKGLHRKMETHLWFPWVMQEYVARRIDRVLTCSDNSAESVQNELRLPPEHVDVVHYGVDVETFRPLADIEKQPNSILFVGNSEDRNKGARYLLEALHPLRHRLQFHLTFLDHRPADQLKLVQALKDKYRLDKNITVLPHADTEELVRLYCRSQIVACPSLYEGFGLPAVEAMACGVPVVATSAGALSEIVEDGVSGILVPPGDAHALNDALRRLLSDPDLCRRMGEAGRQRAVEYFTWRQTAMRTAKVYEEVVGRSAR
jgi:glycosyltransferase involved in cell wall biosynthesis